MNTLDLRERLKAHIDHDPASNTSRCSKGFLQQLLAALEEAIARHEVARVDLKKAEACIAELKTELTHERANCVLASLEARPGDQPLPTKNSYPAIQDLVITDLNQHRRVCQKQVVADIEERKQIGIKRYGTVLQPFNGRDMLLDAYQEALDLAIYLRGCVSEFGEDDALFAHYLQALGLACNLRNRLLLRDGK